MKNYEKTFDFNKLIGLELTYKSATTKGETKFIVKDYKLEIDRVGDMLFITPYVVSEKGNTYRCDEFTEVHFK